MSRRHPSMPPTVFALHLFAMTALHFWAPLYSWNQGASRWLGLAFVLPGVILVLDSVRRFRGRTTLVPGATSDELIETGCYRYSRNPMYTGLVASLAGAFVMFGTLSPGIALPSFVWILTRRFIRVEERLLEARFGAAYRAYKARVRRWL